MTGVLSLLYDIRNINGGFGAFAGKDGGFISKEGKVSNGVVTFEKVNYVAQIDHNL